MNNLSKLQNKFLYFFQKLYFIDNVKIYFPENKRRENRKNIKNLRLN